MIHKNLLKEIIVSNEEFILKHVKKIVEREGILVPETVKKAVVLYGVRRSGKTFILFNFFKKYGDNSAYIDFEDERLADFDLKDFEILKNAVLELKPHLAEERLVLLLDEIQRIDGWERTFLHRGGVTSMYVTDTHSLVWYFTEDSRLHSLSRSDKKMQRLRSFQA